MFGYQPLSQDDNDEEMYQPLQSDEEEEEEGEIKDPLEIPLNDSARLNPGNTHTHTK